jgi:hypothetical protein
MKIAAYLLASFLFAMLSTGCNEPTPATPKRIQPIHRFENVSTTGNLGVALDTATGQWCKTWGWVYKSDADSGGLDTLPTCISLYNLTDAQEDYDSIKPGGK